MYGFDSFRGIDEDWGKLLGHQQAEGSGLRGAGKETQSTAELTREQTKEKSMLVSFSPVLDASSTNLSFSPGSTASSSARQDEFRATCQPTRSWSLGGAWTLLRIRKPSFCSTNPHEINVNQGLRVTCSGFKGRLQFGVVNSSSVQVQRNAAVFRPTPLEQRGKGSSARWG